VIDRSFEPTLRTHRATPWRWALVLLLIASGACGDDGSPGDGFDGGTLDAAAAPDGGPASDGAAPDPDAGEPEAETGFVDWRPVPSTGELDATDRGSRIAYVSAETGDDETGQHYYWDGSQVVDAEGNGYGDDPFDPTGAIQPFATYSRDLLRTANDAGDRFADWVLFRRGEEYPPTGRFPAIGISPEEPSVLGAWGAVSEPRPRFDPDGESFRWQANGRLVVAYAVIRSIEIDARGATNRGGSVGAFMGINDVNLPPEGEPDPLSWLYYEDIRLRGRTQGIVCMRWVECTVARSAVTDMWNADSHVQGAFISGSQVRFHVIDSVFYRNGYKEDPSASDDPQRTIFDRNFYMGGGAQMGVSFDGVLSAYGGSGGPQIRYGGSMQDSLVMEGYWFTATGSNGNLPSWIDPQEGQSFDVHDNVMLVFKYDTPNLPGERDARTHPGNGFHIGGASFGGSFERNIISGALLTELGVGEGFGRPGMHLIGAQLRESGLYPRDYAVRDNIVYDFTGIRFSGEAWDRVSGIEVTGNVWADRGGTAGVTDGSSAPGDAVTFSDNRFYTDRSGTIGGTDLASWMSSAGVDGSGNGVAPRGDAESIEGWSDPDRTLKTYCEDVLGLAVTSPTGLPEFMELALENRLGAWDDRLTARAVVSYIREGFGLDPV